MSTNGHASDGAVRGRIIVVGAGYAGLAAAIELTRKGFEVQVIETANNMTTRGWYQGAHLAKV